MASPSRLWRLARRSPNVSPTNDFRSSKNDLRLRPNGKGRKDMAEETVQESVTYDVADEVATITLNGRICATG